MCYASYQGLAKKCYILLPLYCHKFNKKNPSTITYIEMNDKNNFKHFFNFQMYRRLYESVS